MQALTTALVPRRTVEATRTEGATLTRATTGDEDHPHRVDLEGRPALQEGEVQGTPAPLAHDVAATGTTTTATTEFPRPGAGSAATSTAPHVTTSIASDTSLPRSALD